MPSNMHVERLIYSIKEKEVDLSEYQSFRKAYGQIGCFIEDVYMYKRGHLSPGYLTPVEYQLQWQSIRAAELAEAIL